MTDKKPQPQVKASATTVTVACKIPIGVELQLQRCNEVPEQMISGVTRMVKRWEKFGQSIIVRGTADPAGQAPRGYRRPQISDGGFALTPGVPADFWMEWLSQNQDNPLVTSGMIFAHARRADAEAEAKEKQTLRSGLEPLNPDDDPRMPKSMDGHVSSIQTADEIKGRGPALTAAE